MTLQLKKEGPIYPHHSSLCSGCRFIGRFTDTDGDNGDLWFCTEGYRIRFVFGEYHHNVATSNVQGIHLEDFQDWEIEGKKRAIEQGLWQEELPFSDTPVVRNRTTMSILDEAHLEGVIDELDPDKAYLLQTHCDDLSNDMALLLPKSFLEQFTPTDNVCVAHGQFLDKNWGGGSFQLDKAAGGYYFATWVSSPSKRISLSSHRAKVLSSGRDDVGKLKEELKVARAWQRNTTLIVEEI